MGDQHLTRSTCPIGQHDFLMRDCLTTKGPTLLGETGPFLQLLSVVPAATFTAPEVLCARRSDLGAWQDTSNGSALQLDCRP